VQPAERKLSLDPGEFILPAPVPNPARIAAERVQRAAAGVGSGSGILAEMEPTVRVAGSIHVVGRVAEPDMNINLGAASDIELDGDDPMVRLAVNGAYAGKRMALLG